MTTTGDLGELVERLGLPCRPELLDLALVHRSYSYENGRIPTNERLEFLGDSVLGVVITDHLYTTYPDLPEGQLAKMRSAIVNAQSLARMATEVGLGQYLLLADAMEAIIGAVYLQIGLEGARAFILERFGSLIDAVSHLGAGLDWKTSLQELVAGLGEGPPEYVVSGEGPDHDRVFTAQVRIGGQLYGHGAGKTKKQAEQLAAEGAFAQLQDRSPGDA